MAAKMGIDAAPGRLRRIPRRGEESVDLAKILHSARAGDRRRAA
jgi:hypothetical protein